MIVSEIRLFELLKAKIGEKEAEAFVQILETKVDKKFEEARLTLATKEDIANLKVEMVKMINKMIPWTVATVIACSGIIVTIIKF